MTAVKDDCSQAALIIGVPLDDKQIQEQLHAGGFGLVSSWRIPVLDSDSIDLLFGSEETANIAPSK